MSDEQGQQTEDKKPSWLSHHADLVGRAMASVVGFSTDKFQRFISNSSKTYLATLDAGGNYSVRTSPTTWTVTILRTSGNLDGTKLTIGEMSFTYPSTVIPYDNVTLPKPGMPISLKGNPGDQFVIFEVAIPNYHLFSFGEVSNAATIDNTTDNPVPTSLMGSNTNDVVFQNAVGANGNGESFSVKGFKTLVIEIFGTSSPSGTVSFQAASISGTFATITGVNLNGLTSAAQTSSISTTPTQWQFDIEGLDKFRCPISGWSSGTITVQGRLQV